MDYRYKKNQIFRKKLPVPVYIQNKIYNSQLSFSEFIKYDLEDKVPVDCLWETDRKIVEKFGIEVAKTLDWELLGNERYKMFLLSLEPTETDLKLKLYEYAKDEINPIDYPDDMKELYSDRLFPEEENADPFSEEFAFNRGMLSLYQIVIYWDTFKDKDLSYCLKKDRNNTMGITSDGLKEFMHMNSDLVKIFIDHLGRDFNIYEFISTISSFQGNLTSQEEYDYIKKFTDRVLGIKSFKYVTNEYGEKDIEYSLLDDGPTNVRSSSLTNEDGKVLFDFSSFEEYLRNDRFLARFWSYDIDKLVGELEYLPPDYIFNTEIPFTVWRNSEVFSFASVYGLENIIEFDKECDNFFSKNNCEMLKSFFDMYLHYGNSRFETRDNYDYSRPYTKAEFYEAIKRMILNGPTNADYFNKAPDYREIGGEFRRRFEDLFLSDDAPEELKTAFYTKQITPQFLSEHPDYIPYLKDKNLETCFAKKEVRVNAPSLNMFDEEGAIGEYKNLYDFLSSKTDFTTLMNFLIEFKDVLDTVFKRLDNYNIELTFNESDDFEAVKEKIYLNLRSRILDANMPYPESIPEFISCDKSICLPEDAPQELKDAFYSRTITPEFLLNNPNYKDYLKHVELEVAIRPYIISGINFVKILKEYFNKDKVFDLLFDYGKYLDEISKSGSGIYHYVSSGEELIKNIDETMFDLIIQGTLDYDENAPEHFKKSHPELFLPENVDDKIKSKFYNREFNAYDFERNPKLFESFEHTNIACGLPKSFAWLIKAFDGDIDFKAGNPKILKIAAEYAKIEDFALRKVFEDYIIEFGKDIDDEKIKYAYHVITELSLSNSSEISAFKEELATQILRTEDPLESLKKIEDVFVKNNLPTIGKIFSSFEVLHPDFAGFNFDYCMISPVLKSKSNISKRVVVFSDLVKATLGSNNRSLKTFLENVEAENELYENVKSGETQYDDLSKEEKEKLTHFSKVLSSLFASTMKNRGRNDTYKLTDNTIKNIDELAKRLSPDGSQDYNVADRIIRMFCGFIGVNTVEEAKKYMEQRVHDADGKNRQVAKSDMVLEKGDFVKGIGGIEYLGHILQNGSVAKEFLGASATSDATPLDTDLSMILTIEGSNEEKLDETAAKGYGPIYFVLKNDGRFITTRTPRSEDKRISTHDAMSKFEVFYTGVCGEGHYGIRTGFSSTDINYIMVDSFDERIGLELVKNGFYIPVVNLEGKVIFSPKEYDALREKMQGLSHYNCATYTFSDNLAIKDVEGIVLQIDESEKVTKQKAGKINKVIKETLNELGLDLKLEMDGDLTEGFAELIDTGSTGRGTNKPGDGDFDFMMRLDKEILKNPSRLAEVKSLLLKKLGGDGRGVIGTGDFRLKGVQLDETTNVDIDITFTERNDAIEYSTDMALKDRLENIRKQDPEKYKYVVANILLAKKVLKAAECYKPNRGEVPQGGLGGVGIENWILQNGGSFIDAARSFLEASEGKTFDEFCSNYHIWDFGENHLASKKGYYLHDNFVKGNMSEAGFQKMVGALREYVRSYTKSVEHLGKETYEEQKDVETLDMVSDTLVRHEKNVDRSVDGPTK